MCFSTIVTYLVHDQSFNRHYSFRIAGFSLLNAIIALLTLAYRNSPAFVGLRFIVQDDLRPPGLSQPLAVWPELESCRKSVAHVLSSLPTFGSKVSWHWKTKTAQ